MTMVSNGLTQYFDGRGLGFWVSAVLMVAITYIVGVMGVFFPKTFFSYMMFDGFDYDQRLEAIIRCRGVISLYLGIGWVMAFARRSSMARYIIYFATCFVAVNFCMDLQRIGAHEDWLKTFTSSGFLMLRPVMLLALMCMSYSLSDTAHLEAETEN